MPVGPVPVPVPVPGRGSSLEMRVGELGGPRATGLVYIPRPHPE
jgi:hypothetical protein